MGVLGIDLHKHESQVAVLPDEPADDEPLDEVRVASRTEGSISKEGNKYLRTAVVQGAWRAVHNGQDPYLGEFYHRLRDQKNKPEKVARVAAGRKLLVSIFQMLTREEEYNPPTG